MTVAGWWAALTLARRGSALRAAAHERLVAFSQDGLLVVDRAGQVLEASPAAGRLLGGAAPGRPVAELLPAWSQWAGSAQSSFDLTLGARTLEVRLAPLPGGTAALLRDVTAERQVARSLGVQWHQDLLRQGRRSSLEGRDPLTGLPGRAALDEALARGLQAGERHLTLVLLDLDQPPAGDDLRRFARLLGEHVRASDLVARLDHGRFGVLLSGMGPEAVGRRVELWRSLARDLPSGAPLDFAAGVVGCASGEDAAPETLLRLADQAVHEARRQVEGRTPVRPHR